MPGYISTTPKPFLTGWTRRKKITVDSTEDIRDHIASVRIYNTSGTDTVSEIYLAGNVRSDWGDIRITRSDGLTRIPFAILRIESTYIDIEVKLPVVTTDTTDYYLYYDGPAADVFKIASITDSHYDSGSNVNDRDLTLTFIANFVTRMQSYLPDLAVNNGDKTGASSSSSATQEGWYQDVIDAFANVAPYCTAYKEGVAPGNHDFEYMSFATVLAMHSGDTWMESGVMYGTWDQDDFTFISLDANYNPTNDAHLSAAHNGYGYIDGTQLDWLRTTLDAATKDVIVFVHQPCSEMDTEQWSLTKEIYHTQNREKVRHILEDSGKVIAVIHGHTHFSRIDCINGIPYICTGNLTNDYNNNANLAFGELPTQSEGRWELIEFDKSNRTIRVKHEIRVSSGVYSTVYDTTVPFGPSTYSGGDVSNSPEQVYNFGRYGAAFAKSDFLRADTQLYVSNDDYLRKFPINFNTPDSPTQKNTIRIQGRTDDPNFGRAYWVFNMLPIRMAFEGSFYLTSLSEKYIKFGGLNVANPPCVYLAFGEDGNISAFDGVTEETLQGYSINTWYHIVIFIDASNTSAPFYSVQINGTSYDNGGVGYAFFATTDKHNIRQLEIVTETGDLFIQNFRFRPWTPSFYDNPEIISVGAEETT